MNDEQIAEQLRAWSQPTTAPPFRATVAGASTDEPAGPRHAPPNAALGDGRDPDRIGDAPPRRSRGVLTGVAVVVALLVAVGAIGIAVARRSAEVTTQPGFGPLSTAPRPSLPRIWVEPKDPHGAMEALGHGKVVYDPVNRCFLLEGLSTPTPRYPIVWPHGSTATTDPVGVQIAPGTTVYAGDTISFGGGFVQAAEQYAIPAACLPPSGEVAIVQTI